MRSKNEKGFGIVWIIVGLAVIITAGVGYFVFQSNTDSADNNDSTSSQEIVTEQQNNNEIEEQVETGGTVITTGDSASGTMLFDGAGQAIYIWELEESDRAECYDDCAVAWPPVLTDGMPSATGSVSSDLLGTTKRTDGSTQVTYNGHPLYYYAHEGVGEVKCHNISTHGGLWWVIQPSGVRAE